MLLLIDVDSPPSCGPHARLPSEVIPELRAALKEASPELAESNFTRMDQILEDPYGSQMLAARLLEIFAGKRCFSTPPLSSIPYIP